MKVQKFNRRKLVCTDLDGTFIGDDKPMYKLIDIIEKNNIVFVFSTGRDLALVKEFVRNKKIKNPDACLCQVGTEVYFLKGQKLLLDKNWPKVISSQWQRRKIVEILKEIKEINLQDKRWQTRFKISYFLTKDPKKVLKEIKNRLKKAKLKTKLIYSCGRFLDFLPLKSGKAEALKYIAKELNIKKQDIITCGDSGNDLDFFNQGFKGIIVANAQTELKKYKGKNAYHSAKKYSAGIIEGLKYFNFI